MTDLSDLTKTDSDIKKILEKSEKMETKQDKVMTEVREAPRIDDDSGGAYDKNVVDELWWMAF